jgi:glycosyltransferase involved in cell wall biosynthesis
MDKKILQLINSYAPAFKFGGANRIMFDYAKLLVDSGYEVTVFTTDVKDEDSKLSTAERNLYSSWINITYFNNWSTYLTSRFNSSISPQLWLSVLRRAHLYDYVHISGFRGTLPLLVLIVMRFNKKRLVHSGFGMLSSRSGKRYIRILNDCYDFLITKPLINRIDVALCENSNEALQYRRYGYKGKLVVIPNPVIRPTKASISKSIKMNSTYINLLFLGRIHPSKGIINAIKLTEKLNNYKHQFRLTIIGNDEGDLQNLVSYVNKRELQDSVRFLPPVYGDDRFGFYSQADAYVILPKQNLETSVASIEALSVDTIVLFNNNAFIESADEEKAGINIDDLSNIETVGNILLNARYQGNAQKFFEKYFSTDKIKKMLTSEVFK